MKRFGINLLAVLALCAGLMGTALANGKNLKKTITLDQDILVNDKVIKKGTYQFKFVAADTVVSILDENNVVATVKVNIKENERKAPHNSLAFTTTERGKMLTAITFGGDKRVLHVTELQTTSADE